MARFNVADIRRFNEAGAEKAPETGWIMNLLSP